MIVGITLLRLAGDPQFSPEFSRGGNAAVFSCELLGIAGGSGVDLQVEVQHKNAEDTTWGLLVSFPAMSTVEVKTVAATGIKEQLRFKYIVGGTSATNAAHFNILPPVWRPY